MARETEEVKGKPRPLNADTRNYLKNRVATEAYNAQQELQRLQEAAVEALGDEAEERKALIAKMLDDTKVRRRFDAVVAVINGVNDDLAPVLGFRPFNVPTLFDDGDGDYTGPTGNGYGGGRAEPTAKLPKALADLRKARIETEARVRAPFIELKRRLEERTLEMTDAVMFLGAADDLAGLLRRFQQDLRVILGVAPEVPMLPEKTGSGTGSGSGSLGTLSHAEKTKVVQGTIRRARRGVRR